MKGAGIVEGDRIHVNVHQVNTGRKLVTTVPLVDGMPAIDGDFAIGGVPGHGARIDVDFGDFAGSALGGDVLPTGNPLDTIDVPGIGPLEVSVIDMANLLIFVRARDLGMDTSASIFDMQADTALVGRLEAVRKAVSAHLGYITGPTADEDLRVSTNPLIFAVAEPVDYRATNGADIPAASYDIFSRSLARFEFLQGISRLSERGLRLPSAFPGRWPTRPQETLGKLRALMGSASAIQAAYSKSPPRSALMAARSVSVRP